MIAFAHLRKIYLLCHLLKHPKTNLFVVHLIFTVAVPLPWSWFYYVFYPPNLTDCTSQIFMSSHAIVMKIQNFIVFCKSFYLFITNRHRHVNVSCRWRHIEPEWIKYIKHAKGIFRLWAVQKNISFPFKYVLQNHSCKQTFISITQIRSEGGRYSSQLSSIISILHIYRHYIIISS